MLVCMGDLSVAAAPAGQHSVTGIVGYACDPSTHGVTLFCVGALNVTKGTEEHGRSGCGGCDGALV